VGEAQAQTQGRHGRRGDAAALAGLLAFVAAPFLWRLASGMTALATPLQHDIGFQWIPFHDFIRRAYADGVFPLWSPEVFAGFPFAAFSHGSVFYPPGLLFLFGDYARLVNLYYPLHLCIAASGIFILVRALRIGRLPAFAAAAAYVFSGKPFHFIHFLPATQSNCWMPWLLVGALWAARGRSRGVIVGAATFALAALGGDVESTAYGLVFGAALLVILARDEGLPRRRLLVAAAALAAGAIVAAAQLVPLMELSRWFVRDQGVTFEYFSRRELPAAVAYAIFAPARAVSGFEMPGPYFYLGAAALGLAAAAALGRARPSSRPLFVLTAFVFLFSFGSISLLDRLQYSVPVLRSFGSPEQSFFMGQILLAALVAQGLDAVGKSRWAGLMAGGGLIAFAVMEGLIGWRDGLSVWGWVGCGATVVAGVVAIVAQTSRPADGINDNRRADIIVGHAPEQSSGGEKREQGFRTPKLATEIARASILGKAVPAVIAAALILDPWLLAAGHLPKNTFETFNPPALLKKLSPQLKPASGRTVFVSRFGLSDLDLPHHAGMRLGFDLIDGWITTPIRSYAEVLALADPRVARFKDGKLDYMGLNSDLRDGRFIDAPGMPILDLIGLRWIYDNNLPIKFSSPADLDLIPPEYRRRAIPPAEDNGSTVDSLFWGIKSNANEITRYRLYIDQADRLEITPVVGEGLIAGNGATVEMTIEAKPTDGATENLFSQTRATVPLVEIIGREKTITISLDHLAGREVEFTLSSRGKPGSTAVVGWGASIVNPTRPIQRDPTHTMLYENRDALPRGFLVRDFAVAPPGEDLKLLKTMPAYDLRRKLILTRPPQDLAPVAGAKAGKEARLIRRRSGEEVWKVEAPRPSLLFVSDQYYPGWRALVGDREEPVLRADHAFRAVAVGPGDAEVRFVYQPVSVRVGWWATVAAGFALAVFTGLIRRGRPRPNW